MSCSSADRFVRSAVAVFTTALALSLSHDAAWAKHKVTHVDINQHGIFVDQDSSGMTNDSLGGVHIHRTGDHGLISIDDNGASIVRVFADAQVPAGDRIAGDVVAVFGSVEVEGQVDGDVVAVMGSVHLRPGAIVDGDVVAIGGGLDQADDVVVNGQSVSLGLFPVPWGVPAIPVLLAFIFAGWLGTWFAGWIFAALFPGRMVRVAATASRRTAASFLLGLISLPGFVVALALLFITVIGIPIALVLPIAYVVLQYAGQIAATYVLGCKLTSRPIGSGGLLGPLTAGTLFVATFFAIGAVLFAVPGVARPAALFFCLLGILLLLGLTWIGTGAFLLSRFGADPKEMVWNPAAPAVPRGTVAPLESPSSPTVS